MNLILCSGPAALATVLAASGIEVTPDELEPKIYLSKRRGSPQFELLAASRRYERLPYVIDGQLTALLAELNAGHPVLVLQYLVWHYAVVMSADPAHERIILRSDTTKQTVMTMTAFLKRWERAGFWGFTALRPGELPYPAP